MVTFVPKFVSPPVAAVHLELAALERAWLAEHGGDAAAVTALPGRWRAEHPVPRATLAQVADHVDHVREVAGVEHVGIGGDFDGVDELPEGLGDVSAYPALFAELRRRGWADDELRAGRREPAARAAGRGGHRPPLTLPRCPSRLRPARSSRWF
jgi:membrane dipeptidase